VTISQVLLSQDQIRKRVEELGEEISRDYADREVALICILKGAAWFAIDLSRAISSACTVDFMAVSSYGADTRSSGVVKITQDLTVSLSGRHVLMVDDIIDTGLTASFLMRHLGGHQPASLKLCALLSKQERREQAVSIDYLGFEIPNHFVVGYGLDFEERYRNLGYVGILDSEPAGN
jgi:hypoxanthine phosphoribosyltransferase